MQALLEAGYTTILSGGGPADGNITLRDHIDKGVINGPRIIPSGAVRLNNGTPEAARAEMRKMAEMGVKFTGEICADSRSRADRERIGSSQGGRGRGEESGRDGSGPRGELEGDGGRRRRRRAAAGSPSQQRLGEQRGREESRRRRHEGTGDGRLRLARVRRVRGRQQAAVPRWKAVARRDRRRGPPRRGSRIHAGECAHDLGCGRHPRLLHRHNL